MHTPRQRCTPCSIYRLEATTADMASGPHTEEESGAGVGAGYLAGAAEVHVGVAEDEGWADAVEDEARECIRRMQARKRFAATPDHIRHMKASRRLASATRDTKDT
eukprot:1108737-Rhodomonas_salina.1